MREQIATYLFKTVCKWNPNFEVASTDEKQLLSYLFKFLCKQNNYDTKLTI